VAVGAIGRRVDRDGGMRRHDGVKYEALPERGQERS
jgi:hypothetical protein